MQRLVAATAFLAIALFLTSCVHRRPTRPARCNRPCLKHEWVWVTATSCAERRYGKCQRYERTRMRARKCLQYANTCQ